MPKKSKTGRAPRLVVPRNATLKQIYAIARKQFSAADLQEYTDPDNFNEVLRPEILFRELELINARVTAKKRAGR